MKAADAAALGIDLLDVRLFVERREHEAFARLRAQAPVCRHQGPDGAHFHAVTRYDDVCEVMRQPTLFSSAQGTQIADRRAEGHGAASVHNSDPPRHAALRAVVLPALRKKAADALEPGIRLAVNELLDTTPDGAGFDFVEKVATPLPMMVIARLLGVPAADRRHTVDWANTMSDVGAGAQEQARARHELFTYFRALVAERRACPADDVATLLATAQVEGQPLTEGELDAYFLLLVVAGNETTRFLVSIGLEQLLRQPDDLAELRARPEGLATAVEEMARFVSPVIHMRRTVTAPCTLAGHELAPGDRVVAYFASANRDERQFAAADRLQPARAPNPHLAFGFGAHFCLGAHVARTEARVLFEEMFRRVRDIQPRGPAVRAPSHWFNGLASLPLAWRRT